MSVMLLRNLARGMCEHHIECRFYAILDTVLNIEAILFL